MEEYGVSERTEQFSKKHINGSQKFLLYAMYVMLERYVGLCINMKV